MGCLTIESEASSWPATAGHPVSINLSAITGSPGHVFGLNINPGDDEKSAITG
jgi:hypothetical protein